MTEELTRVLLVEDDEIDRMAMLRHVAQEGLAYDVRTAASEAQALEMLRGGGFDVVLLDYDLGTATAFDIMPHAGDAPVILLTGHGSEELAVAAIRQGARDYMIKDTERNYLTVLPLTIQNVLDRARAEAALSESEERLRSTIASMDDLVFLLDADGVFVDYYQPSTRSELYRPPEEFIGKPFQDVLPPHVARPIQEILGVLAASGESQMLDYSLEVAGEEKWFSAKFSIRRGSSGKYAGVTGVVRDITERKRMEEALREAMERELAQQRARATQVDRLLVLGEMAAGMAHELNQPLAAISLTAERAFLRLEKGIGLSPELMKEMMTDVEAMVDRMRNIIDHMRVFARDTSEEAATVFGVDRVIEDTLKLAEAQLRNNGIDLRVDVAEGLPWCRGWPNRIEQVLLNLIANARDAMIERSDKMKAGEILIDPEWQATLRIEVKEDPSDGIVRIDVSDTGGGIPEDMQPKIFDPFFTTKEAGKGTGLGLSIIKGIMEDHSGCITCWSREGEGTRMSLSLPVEGRE